MCKLSKQIKQLDASITADKALLGAYTRLLGHKVSQPPFLFAAAISGFLLGFILEHKVARKVSGALVTTVPFFLKDMYQNFLLIRSFLPM